MHYYFVSPIDNGFKAEDGDTWTTFDEGRRLVHRRFKNGEWREYEPLDEMEPWMRDMILEARNRARST